MNPIDARISIIGAGPGGLTAARILQRHGLTVTVYDGDAGPDARNQGGTLDLREDDGQLALREAGLLEGFDALARPEGQEMRLVSPTGHLLEHHVPDPDDRFKPEIDRGQLRNLLLDSLEPGTVRWGHRLAAVEDSSDGVRTLVFEDGQRIASDLVIGADGAWSVVRKALSGALPEYTGVTFLEARFDDVERRHPELAALVGQGGLHAMDGDRGIFAQRNSGDHIRAYIMRRVPEARSLPATDVVRDQLLSEFAAWSPELLRFVTDNDGTYENRPLHVLPVPHRWEHSPSVTLLGDAAHLMPPVGVGVNLAMLDACELALALANSATVDEAVRAYEETMFPRSIELARDAADGPEHLLGAEDADDADDTVSSQA